MKKALKASRGFFWTGIVLVLIAAGFLLYAMGHPEASFPWCQGITNAICIVYQLLVVAAFAVSLLFRKKAGKGFAQKAEEKE